MYMNDKATLLGGIVMILLAVGIVVAIAAGSSIGDNSPFEDDEVGEFLEDVHDSETAVLISSSAGIINDGVLALSLAAILFVLFRDRSRLLALITLAGFVAQATVAMVVDGSTILLTIVADDYVNGGPAGIDAGDPAAREVGRVLGMTTFLFTNVAFTALGTGLLALGITLAYSPEGAINPPRWLGYVAIFAGLAAWLAWTVAVVDIGFIFFILQGLSSLVLLIGLGYWLVMHRDLRPAAA